MNGTPARCIAPTICRLSREVFLAQRQRIAQKVRHHFIGEAAPGYIAPVGRNVLVEWIVLQVALVEKGSAALPGQRGYLPCLVLRQQFDERVASLLVLRREQQFQIAFALDEFVLFRGTAFENAHQMLDTLLPRFDNFPNANFIRNMADNGQALACGLPRQRQGRRRVK